MAIKFPPNWQLKKILRQKCTLRKKTVTMINDEYEQGTESFTNYAVDHCEIQPITSEDLVYLPPGTLNIGDARGWFKELISSIACKSDFDISSLYTYDSTKILVEGGEAKLKPGSDPCMLYPINNPTISRTDGCTFSVPAIDFEVEETIPIKTNIKYILSGNDGLTWRYWNGTIWTFSDETYDKANTSQEIKDHLSTLPFTSGTFTWKAFLHSDDGTATPILKLVQMTFGIKLEVEDQIIDHQNKRYEIMNITDYYTKDGVLLKEVYLRKRVGEA